MEIFFIYTSVSQTEQYMYIQSSNLSIPSAVSSDAISLDHAEYFPI